MLGFHFPALSALQEDDCFSFHSELPTEKHVVSTVMIYDITYIYIFICICMMNIYMDQNQKGVP